MENVTAVLKYGRQRGFLEEEVLRGNTNIAMERMPLSLAGRRSSPGGYSHQQDLFLTVFMYCHISFLQNVLLVTLYSV